MPLDRFRKDKTPRPRNPVPLGERVKEAGREALKNTAAGIAYGLVAAAILAPAVPDIKKQYTRIFDDKRSKTPEAKQAPKPAAQPSEPVPMQKQAEPQAGRHEPIHAVDQALVERVRGIPALISLSSDELSQKAPALARLLNSRVSAKDKCEEIAKVLRNPAHLDDILTVSIFLSKDSAQITNQALREDFMYQREKVLNMTPEQISASPDEAKRKVLADIQSSKSYKTITGGCNRALMFVFGGILEEKIQKNKAKAPSIVDEILRGVAKGDERAIGALEALGRIREALIQGQ